MNSISGTREYYPELLSRRGEYTSWGLAIACLIAWMILTLGGYRVHIALPIMTIAFIFISIGISLGNWMDRHTVIRINSEGVEFHNGLRNAMFPWRDICEVILYTHKWGDKVYVMTETARFNFRKFGEVKVRGETKGVMGFPDGEEVFQTIISEAELVEVEHKDNEYYYARE